MVADFGSVREVQIESEMREAYLDYAMSVIVQRALPDVRDGLKPVHRRILHAMNELGLRSTTHHRKCATVVGEVLGKYHPHSDTAVYDSMVRLAQDFSMRYRLIDGQGNFGSVDGDAAAAMRYTECRMAAITDEMLADIDKNTVDFIPNYDGNETEPTVLPAKLPQLLLNGVTGIAVGMATNIPPHNLTELVNGLIYLISHPEATVVELSEIIKGPDFPTGGIILGQEGITSAYATGRGRIILRCRHQIEEVRSGRTAIIVTELPYQVNKARLQERIAELVQQHDIEGIADLRDESDRDGMRLVIEMKRDAHVQHVLNQLYKHTQLQEPISINMLALVDNQPRVLTLEMVLRHYLNHRRVVVRRRTEFDLDKARARAHVLEGLATALNHLDAVIRTIRAATSSDAASQALQTQFALTETQAKAILALQLSRLAALEQQKIRDELAEIQRRIAEFEAILGDPARIDAIIVDELTAMRDDYGDTRKTVIVHEELGSLSEDDLVAPEDVIVSMTTRGYIKRILASTYRPQRRGGKGIVGMVARDQDEVNRLLACNTHDNLLFFTTRGRAYQLKVHELPATGRQARGVPVNNLIGLEPHEGVTAVLVMPKNGLQCGFLILATRQGVIKRTALESFTNLRRTGLQAITVDPDDELAWVEAGTGEEDVILVTTDGRAIRFPQSDVRSMGRTAAGVYGIRLRDGDQVVAMGLARPDHDLLVVTTHGIGKRTSLDKYPVQGRYGQGVYTLRNVEKIGSIVAAAVVNLDMEMVLMSAAGQVIRQPVKMVRQTGRNTEGVRVMSLNGNDTVVSMACMVAQPEAEDATDGVAEEAESEMTEALEPEPLAVDDIPEELDGDEARDEYAE
ncbi:MAG TPA: DNA gyrase subunit A [Chloroflexota bacterium]|nr:DNA gyrase subunit A [Chloroflexota bacterium]